MSSSSSSSSIFNPSTSIYTSPRPSLPSSSLSILHFLFRHVHRHLHLPALIDSASGDAISFHQLRTGIASASAVLHRLGIAKSDVVLILAPNSHLFPLAFLSIVSLGAIATTANPLSTVYELSKQTADSKAKLVITVPELAQKVRSLGLPMILMSDLVVMTRV